MSGPDDPESAGREPRAGDASVATEKALLRRVIRSRRRSRSQSDRTLFAESIAGIAVRDARIAAAGRVAAYVSVGDEPGTGPLLSTLHAEGLDILLPVVSGPGRLDWARYAGRSGLASGLYGLSEPTGPRLGPAAIATAGVVLTPALAVDRAGRRLGQGGGYYDRALTLVRPGCPVIAVVHDDEVLPRVPASSHDRRVSAALTASGVLALPG